MGIKAALPVTTVAGKSKIGISPGAMSPASAYSGHRVHEAAAVPQVSVPPPFRTGRTHALLPARHGVYRQKAKGSSLNRLAPGYFHRAGASVAVSYQHDRQPGISPSQLFQLHRYFSAPVKKMIWQTVLLLKEVEKVMGEAPGNPFSTRLKQPANMSPKPPMNTARYPGTFSRENRFSVL